MILNYFRIHFELSYERRLLQVVNEIRSQFGFARMGSATIFDKKH